MMFQNAIRYNTMTTLRFGNGMATPELENLFCSLESMEALANRALELATRERLWVEKDKFQGETGKIKLEGEITKAKSEKVIAAVMARIKTEEEKIKAQKK